MILWKFLYSDELSKTWIKEEDIYNASIILNSSFWSDYFKNIENKLQNKDKGWIIKLFNAPMIYKILAFPTIENNILLVELSRILKLFCNEKSISEYISRLKDDNLCDSWLFELFTACTFKKNWFNVNLQKQNYSNNPVEVHFNYFWVNFWIECKSYKFKPSEESFSQKIMRKINYLIDILPKYSAINIILNNEPKDDIELNNIIKECKKNIENFSKNNIYDNYEFNYWKIEYLKYDEFNIKTTFDNIYSKSIEVIAKSIWKENKNYKWLPEAGTIDNNYINIIWIWCKKDLNLDKKLFNDDKLLNDISKKIKQQENILKTWDEVIIIFDKNAYNIESIEKIKNDCNKKYLNYYNLTVLICEFKTNINKWTLDWELQPIITSLNFSKLYK